MINLIDVCNHYCKSVGKDTNGETLEWSKIRILKEKKEKPDSIFSSIAMSKKCFEQFQMLCLNNVLRPMHFQFFQMTTATKANKDDLI